MPQATVPTTGWTPAYDADGQVRPGAWGAELAGLSFADSTDDHDRKIRVKSASQVRRQRLGDHVRDRSQLALARLLRNSTIQRLSTTPPNLTFDTKHIVPDRPTILHEELP
jgi:hypothetical protein